MPTKLTRLRGRRKAFTPGNARTNVVDDAGTVQVNVILIDPERGHHQTGNITRSFRVQNARVSDVAQSLESWLFVGGGSAKVPHVRL